VEKALESILSQETDFPFEIVLGDDCSTDGTTEILESYCERFPKQIVLLKATENLGKITGNGRFNFLRLLENCRGKYIALLEGDDYWTDPKKLQLQFEALENNTDVFLAVHDVQIRHEKTGRKEPLRNDGDRTVFDLASSVGLQSNFHTASFVVPKTLFDNLPDFAISIQSLDILIIALAAIRGPVLRIPRAMAVYRKNLSSVTNNASYKGTRLQLARANLYSHLMSYSPKNRSHFASLKRSHVGLAVKSCINKNNPLKTIVELSKVGYSILRMKGNSVAR
jgi:glycosyltransferase involved in cell wall biosynthesis